VRIEKFNVVLLEKWYWRVMEENDRLGIVLVVHCGGCWR